jgi:hypothetical protein
MGSKGAEIERADEETTPAGKQVKDVRELHARIREALLDWRKAIELAPEDIMADIVRRTLEAPDATAALKPETVYHARDVLGVPLRLFGVKWNESRYPDGPPVYAVADCLNLQTGERAPVTCGSVRVLAQLLKIDMEAAWPQDVVVLESDQETREGFHPMRLEAIAGDVEVPDEVAQG